MPSFEIRLFTKRSNSLTLLEDKLFLVSYFWGVKGRAFFFLLFPRFNSCCKNLELDSLILFRPSWDSFLCLPSTSKWTLYVPASQETAERKGRRASLWVLGRGGETFLAASSKGRICVDRCIHFSLPASPLVNTPAHTIPTKVIISASIIPP